MDDFIPPRLRARLGDERSSRLADLLGLIARELGHVYEMDSSAYDPGVGDNPQLYGLGIWHHGWFAIEQALGGDWPEVTISHEGNSYRLLIWELTLAVYKGGDTEAESIYDVDLNGSETKKGYATRNKAQLQLFSVEELEVPEEERAFDLNELWVVHFGNPRDQLVKLYVGAPSFDDLDHKAWAWHRRIDVPGRGGGDGSREPVAPAPFSDQPEPAIDLELKEDVKKTSAGDGE